VPSVLIHFELPFFASSTIFFKAWFYTFTELPVQRISPPDR
jgi:hypothetical protein